MQEAVKERHGQERAVLDALTALGGADAAVAAVTAFGGGGPAPSPGPSSLAYSRRTSLGGSSAHSSLTSPPSAGAHAPATPLSATSHTAAKSRQVLCHSMG